MRWCFYMAIMAALLLSSAAHTDEGKAKYHPEESQSSSKQEAEPEGTCDKDGCDDDAGVTSDDNDDDDDDEEEGEETPKRSLQEQLEYLTDLLKNYTETVWKKEDLSKQLRQRYLYLRMKVNRLKKKTEPLGALEKRAKELERGILDNEKRSAHLEALNKELRSRLGKVEEELRDKEGEDVVEKVETLNKDLAECQAVEDHGEDERVSYFSYIGQFIDEANERNQNDIQCRDELKMCSRKSNAYEAQVESGSCKEARQYYLGMLDLSDKVSRHPQRKKDLAPFQIELVRQHCKCMWRAELPPGESDTELSEPDMLQRLKDFSAKLKAEYDSCTEGVLEKNEKFKILYGRQDLAVQELTRCHKGDNAKDASASYGFKLF